MPAGSKTPTGIVASFADDWSRDPAQWDAWRAANPGCNFGIVAGPSALIIVDIDVTEVGREKAWKIWCEWWNANADGTPPTPQIQSARGGWHYYFSLPPDAPLLRQVQLVGPAAAGTRKAVVDLRVGNGFTVAAGSYYDGTAKGEESGSYLFLSDAAPYPAPAALIRHAARPEPVPATAKIGGYNIADVAGMFTFLDQKEAFASYEAWWQAGGALKLEFGDAGYPIWLGITWDVDQPTAPAKWASFDSEPSSKSVTLATFMKEAHRLGWTGKLRQTSAAMWGEDAIDQLAASAGATRAGAMPLTGNDAHLLHFAGQYIRDFLNDTANEPNAPCGVFLEHPQLPEAAAERLGELYQPTVDAIDRLFAIGEKPGRLVRIGNPLGALKRIHADTYDAIARRFTNAGVSLPQGEITRVYNRIETLVKRTHADAEEWRRDSKDRIENDNADNVDVLIKTELNMEVRWNNWIERLEMKGGNKGDPTEPYFDDWAVVDDAVISLLRARASRTETRFNPTKDTMWDGMLALGRRLEVDPATDYLASLRWDGNARLAGWIARSCGLPDDAYYQAVSRNVVGGMVRRIRHPGCKHDLMALFIGRQGTGKSTLAAILADMGRSDLATIRRESSPWFDASIKLGDDSKELILSLAGKTVVEVAEMGKRNSADIDHIKAMLSRQVDAGRTAYARSVRERPRRNIFVGTSNPDQPLTDATGNRRFLPVRVDVAIDLEWLSANMAQIVAEAAALEAGGETFDLPEAVWDVAAEHQEAARSISDAELRLTDWLAPTDMQGEVSFVMASDLAELMAIAGYRNSSTTGRGTIMKRLGFEQQLIPIAGKRRMQAWVRGDAAPSDVARVGTRFLVGQDATGRPQVTIRGPGPSAS